MSLIAVSCLTISGKTFPSKAVPQIGISDKSEKTYIVKRNESLWVIAGRRDIFNNPLAWPVLYRANSHSLKNQNIVREGFSISIPELLPDEKIKYDNIRDSYFKDTFRFSIKELIKKSEQFLVVTSKDWDSTKANLVYYEKQNGRLLKISDSIQVNLGDAGLGWGSGLTEFNKVDGPVKHEGDGRSPAGIFKLSYAFGYLPQDSLSWLNYPYKQVTTRIECVDDTSSIYYNKLMDVDRINKTWKRSEIMRGKGSHYKFGIIVEHNSNPRIPGCGSCIFIHIWSSYGKPTTGCTSMSEDQIVKLLHWLSAKKKPLLIQLPEKEFNKIRLFLNL